MFFFIFCITGNLQNLHTVKKGSGNFLNVVGCGNKKNLGKILGNFHIMIIKAAVLLRVKNLQKRRSRISPVIASCFIYFIQKHQRIADTCLLQSRCDPSGHGSYISSSVSSDLSFIPDTAQTDTDIFFVKGLCHRSGNRSLSGSRRSHKTEDRAFSALCQLSHRKEFHDPFLYLFQSVMSFFKNFPGLCQIVGILRTSVPRKRQKCFNISSKHRTFC